MVNAWEVSELTCLAIFQILLLVHCYTFPLWPPFKLPSAACLFCSCVCSAVQVLSDKHERAW